MCIEDRINVSRVVNNNCKKCETTGIRVIDDRVDRTKVTKYLGSWLDEN